MTSFLSARQKKIWGSVLRSDHWQDHCIFLQKLNTLDAVEEAIRIANEGDTDLDHEIPGYFRGNFERWPEPDLSMPSGFYSRYPLLAKRIQGTGRKHAFLRAAEFANCNVDFFAGLIEEILRKRRDGAKRIEIQATKFHDGKTQTENPPKNQSCFVFVTTSFYTQMQTTLFRHTVLPRFHGGGFAGAHSGGGSRAYIEWPYAFLDTTTLYGKLRVGIKGLLETTVISRKRVRLIEYIRKALGTEWGLELTRYAVISFSEADRLLVVEDFEKFYHRSITDVVRVKCGNKEYSLWPADGKPLGKLLAERVIPPNLNRGEPYSSLIEVLSFDGTNLAVRLRPAASIPIPKDPDRRWQDNILYEPF